MSIDQRTFRNALGCFATGITVVTTLTDAGAPIGITINSFTSVSLDPPLVLFALERETVSLPFFLATRRFAVNILAENQRDLSVRFALPLPNKWEGVSWHSGHNGCPLLAGTLASLECDLETTYEGGDHLILMGRVAHVEIERVGHPLLYFRGQYSILAPGPGEAA